MVSSVASVSVSGGSVKVWSPLRKTPQEAEAVKEIYARFEAGRDGQRIKFKKEYIDKLSAQDKENMKKQLNALGMDINFETSHVNYLKDFKPLALDYDLCYVRHGKTEGNTEPRIYQGFCDYWENQLNATGKAQAVEAAGKMEKMVGDGSFVPDLIICSPLGRAVETGEAFFNNHKEIPTRSHYNAREQQFGAWDNVQLRYLPEDSVCHLFYLDQNALVKSEEPHCSSDGSKYPSENFVELIIRQQKFLTSLNDEEEIKAKTKAGKRGKVLIYGHSMAGAACSALLGHGKVAYSEDGGLGFDGKYIMPNATPTILEAKSPF